MRASDSPGVKEKDLASRQKRSRWRACQITPLRRGEKIAIECKNKRRPFRTLGVVNCLCQALCPLHTLHRASSVTADCRRNPSSRCQRCPAFSSFPLPKHHNLRLDECRFRVEWDLGKFTKRGEVAQGRCERRKITEARLHLSTKPNFV